MLCDSALSMSLPSPAARNFLSASAASTILPCSSIPLANSPGITPILCPVPCSEPPAAEFCEEVSSGTIVSLPPAPTPTPEPLTTFSEKRRLAPLKSESPPTRLLSPTRICVDPGEWTPSHVLL